MALSIGRRGLEIRPRVGVSDMEKPVEYQKPNICENKKSAERPQSNLQCFKEASALDSYQLYKWFKGWAEEETDSDEE